jgi:hypothetical protein
MMPSPHVSEDDGYDKEGEEENEEEEEEEEEENEEEEEDDEIILPQSYESVLGQLFEGNPIAVKSLLLNDNEEKLSFARLMWDFDLVKTGIQTHRKRKADTHKTFSQE